MIPKFLAFAGNVEFIDIFRGRVESFVLIVVKAARIQHVRSIFMHSVIYHTLDFLYWL